MLTWYAEAGLESFNVGKIIAIKTLWRLVGLLRLIYQGQSFSQRVCQIFNIYLCMYTNCYTVNIISRYVQSEFLPSSDYCIIHCASLQIMLWQRALENMESVHGHDMALDVICCEKVPFGEDSMIIPRSC